MAHFNGGKMLYFLLSIYCFPELSHQGYQTPVIAERGGSWQGGWRKREVGESSRKTPDKFMGKLFLSRAFSCFQFCPQMSICLWDCLWR